MKILLEKDNKLTTSFNPIFIKLFLSTFILAGFFSAYKYLMGDQNIGLYGVFIFFALPIAVLNFLIAKVTIRLTPSLVRVNKRYLFRETNNTYQTSDLVSFRVLANKGSNSSGTYSLVLYTHTDSVPLITGFASLSNKSAKLTVEKMSLYLKETNSKR